MADSDHPPHLPLNRFIGSDADPPPPTQPHPHPNSVRHGETNHSGMEYHQTNHFTLPEYHQTNHPILPEYHQMLPPQSIRNVTTSKFERDINRQIHCIFQYIMELRKNRDQIKLEFQKLRQYVDQKSDPMNHSQINNQINNDERSGDGGANGVENDERSGDGDPFSFDSSKKRVVWSPELHNDFVNAVKSIGPERAVPKKILEVMKSKGHNHLRREHIASHLQKYRESMGKSRKPHPNNNTPGVVSAGDQLFSTPTFQNNPPSANAIGMPLSFQNNPSSTNLICGPTNSQHDDQLVLFAYHQRNVQGPPM